MDKIQAKTNTNQKLREIAEAHDLNPEKFRLFWNTRFDNNDMNYAKEWAERLQQGRAHLVADRETREALRQAGLTGDNR